MGHPKVSFDLTLPSWSRTISPAPAATPGHSAAALREPQETPGHVRWSGECGGSALGGGRRRPSLASRGSSAPSPHFELDRIEHRLQQMDVAVVGGDDDEVASGPARVFKSADEKRQGALFEHVVIDSFKFVIGSAYRTALDSVMPWASSSSVSWASKECMMVFSGEVI
jgi:hypothetical protein